MDNRLTCPTELCRLASFSTHGVNQLGYPVLARWIPGGSVPTHGYCANCANLPELGAGASWRPAWPPCSTPPVPRSPAQQSSTPSPSRSPDLSRSLRGTPSRAYRRHFVRLPLPNRKAPGVATRDLLRYRLLVTSLVSGSSSPPLRLKALGSQDRGFSFVWVVAWSGHRTRTASAQPETALRSSGTW